MLRSERERLEATDIGLYPRADRARSQPRIWDVRDLGRNPMKFRPLQDRVLIRRTEEEEKTAGGIIIPDTAKEKPMEGEVIAAGPGSRGDDGKLHPLDVKVGDRVLFGKRAPRSKSTARISSSRRRATSWAWSKRLRRKACVRGGDYGGKGNQVSQRRARAD